MVENEVRHHLKLLKEKNEVSDLVQKSEKVLLQLDNLKK